MDHIVPMAPFYCYTQLKHITSHILRRKPSVMFFKHLKQILLYKLKYLQTGTSVDASNIDIDCSQHTKYNFPFRLNASFKLTMLFVFSMRKILTSRSVVLRTISSSASN